MTSFVMHLIVFWALFGIALELNRPSEFRWAAGTPNSVKFVVGHSADKDV